MRFLNCIFPLALLIFAFPGCGMAVAQLLIKRSVKAGPR